MTSRWHPPALAWPRGQCADRVRSLGPGRGRLHWQRWPNGVERVHRDRWDPERGPAEAVVHVVRETALIPILLVVAAIAVVFLLLIAAASRTARRRA